MNVVRFVREQFLQSVCGTVCFQRPNFHLTKALTTKLCFTTQWLLGNHRVWSGRTCVNLVVDQVVQLQHVHVADGDLFWEWFARATVMQSCLTVTSNQTDAVACWVDVIKETCDFFGFCPIEDRGGHIDRSGFAWQVR